MPSPDYWIKEEMNCSSPPENDKFPPSLSQQLLSETPTRHNRIQHNVQQVQYSHYCHLGLSCLHKLFEYVCLCINVQNDNKLQHFTWLKWLNRVWLYGSAHKKEDKHAAIAISVVQRHAQQAVVTACLGWRLGECLNPCQSHSIVKSRDRWLGWPALCLSACQSAHHSPTSSTQLTL